jgi:hypothetical protein
MAVVGRAPVTGQTYALQDSRWLLGVANGLNRSSQNTITAAAGGTKAAAFQLPAAIQLFEVDTVANDNDSVLLPAAKAGQIVFVFNNGAHILGVYGRGTDTINQSVTATQYSMAAALSAVFFCAKDGAWAAVKSA